MVIDDVVVLLCCCCCVRVLTERVNAPQPTRVWHPWALGSLLWVLVREPYVSPPQTTTIMGGRLRLEPHPEQRGHNGGTRPGCIEDKKTNGLLYCDATPMRPWSSWRVTPPPQNAEAARYSKLNRQQTFCCLYMRTCAWSKRPASLHFEPLGACVDGKRPSRM